MKKQSLTDILDIFMTQENCITGICDALPLPSPPEGFTPFVSQNRLKRTHPSLSLPGAKSIMVFCVKNEAVHFPPMPEDAGILSVLAATKDYHESLKALIKKFVGLLQSYGYPSVAYKILVDSSTLDERALAVKAKLGYIGKNGLLITPEYGSRHNIGILLTDIPMRISALPDEKISPSACPETCNKCVEACPSGALTGGYAVENCISYLTQKEDLAPEEESKLGRHLYGCDVCQDICPKNQPAQTAWAMPEDWLAMSDEDLASTYVHTAMSWCSPERLKRNARAVIANR